MITEIMIAVLFLSVSFYVSALLVSILYYLFSSLSVLNMKEGLTKGVVMQYIAFNIDTIIIVIVTAQWL